MIGFWLAGLVFASFVYFDAWVNEGQYFFKGKHLTWQRYGSWLLIILFYTLAS